MLAPTLQLQYVSMASHICPDTSLMREKLVLFRMKKDNQKLGLEKSWAAYAHLRLPDVMRSSFDRRYRLKASTTHALTGEFTKVLEKLKSCWSRVCSVSVYLRTRPHLHRAFEVLLAASSLPLLLVVLLPLLSSLTYPSGCKIARGPLQR